MDSGEAWTGQGYLPVNLLRLHQADVRAALESLLRLRCLRVCLGQPALSPCVLA